MKNINLKIFSFREKVDIGDKNFMKSYILPISIILIIAVLIGSVVLVLINIFKGSDESIIKKDNAPSISPESSFSVPFRYNGIFDCFFRRRKSCDQTDQCFMPQSRHMEGKIE